MEALCSAKRMKLCNNAELCVGGNPPASLNKFAGDNWIATGDNTNSWLTFSPGRACKSHEQVAGAPPAWGTINGPDGWTRAAKCCPGAKPSEGTWDYNSTVGQPSNNWQQMK